MANEKLNRKAQCHKKRGDEALNLEETTGSRSVKVKMSMRLKADQDPESCSAALPPDETNARRFGVDIEDSSDSSSDSSSSGASSRLSSAASRHSPVTSHKDSESANNGQKGGRKSRKWFRLKDKVVPL